MEINGPCNEIPSRKRPLERVTAPGGYESEPRKTIMDFLSRDLRFALRSLVRNRSTSAIAMLTFGLGIAACTAMFSIVNAVLLRPLPYPEPDRVVNVYQTHPQLLTSPGFDGFAERGSFSYPELEDIWRANPDVLDGFAMAYTGGGTLRPPEGPPERITVGTTTPDLLGRIMRVVPRLGRVFVAEDGTEHPNAAVLGESFWRSRFAGAPDVVGKTMRLGDRTLEIIGVVPAGTRISNAVPDAWTLLQPWENRGDHRTSAIGRLAPGVTPERASQVLSAITLANVPPNHSPHGANVQPRQAEIVRHVRTPLVMLAAAAFILLLIASANVAALLVGRLLDRQDELMVRVALGAGRLQLFRQILTETLVLAGSSAILGILLSAVALRGLELIAPPGLPRIDEVRLDGMALLVSVGISMLAGLFAGIIPALGMRPSRRQASMARSRDMAAGRARLQGGVVVAEIAMATVLLVGGGLLARTVTALGGADPGFAIRELASFDVSLPSEGGTEDPGGLDPATGDATPVRDRLGDLAREIETLPGVRGVALTSVLPLSASRANNGLEFEGYQSDDAIVAERRFVSGDFFEVGGIPIVEGRAFDMQDDRADAPGRMIISEGLARHVWPAESAVGKTVVYWGRETTVVGVAADQRDEQLRETTEWAFYVPRVQAGQLGGSFMVRTESPIRVLTAVRARIRQVEPGAAIVGLQPMTQLAAAELAEETYRARLAILFAALATLFAVMGIYGVTGRAVAARTREFGIRKALGATDRLIMRQVLGRAGRLAVAGGLLGLVLSFAVTRWVEGLLWGVARTDPLTLVAVAGTLTAGAILAAWGPGRRARRLDPAVALRSE